MHSRDPCTQGHDVPQATHFISLDCMTEIFISEISDRNYSFQGFLPYQIVEGGISPL